MKTQLAEELMVKVAQNSTCISLGAKGEKPFQSATRDNWERKIAHIVLFWFGVTVCGFSQFGESRADDRIEIDLRRNAKPEDRQRERVGELLSDLETRSLAVDRLAVAVTGEYYIGAVSNGKQVVNGKRFGYSWCIDNEKDFERLVYADQSLIDPVVFDGADTRVMLNTSLEYDRLRLVTTYHEAAGLSVRAPSDSSFLSGELKRCGVFFPVSAVVITASEIYSGKAFSRNKLNVDVKHIVGIREAGNVLQAEFEYRPTPLVAYIRVITFRDDVPVQVDDWLALGDGIPPLGPEQLRDRDRKELAELHKVAKPYARTLTTWSKVGDLHVPTSIKSSTLSGPNAIEVNAEFAWRINDQVPDSAFAIETVGQVGPLSILK